jgi:hypothetical protein
LVPGAVGNIAFGVDGDELGIGTGSHLLGNALGMAVAGMIDNDNLGHGESLCWK